MTVLGLSQFLIGKVELPKEDFQVIDYKVDGESQFLIGKVEQEAGLSPKGEFYMWVLKSQFLIGKV